MAKIINGQKIAWDISKRLKKEIKSFKKRGETLKIACVLVGEDKSSLSFIRRKEKTCSDLGIDFELFKFQKTISQKELIRKINVIQKDKDLSGLIIQLPLPKKFKTHQILEEINPDLDIDCLTSVNLGKLAIGNPVILPPTVGAILDILKRYKINFKGKHIVIVGRGDLVGKPLAILLTQEKNTITSCNKYTKNLSKFTKEADILISGAGQANLITGSMIKKGAVVLDAGTDFLNKKLVGDVKFKEVAKKASLISPVPGGIGPVMVVKLLENVVNLAKRRAKN